MTTLSDLYTAISVLPGRAVDTWRDLVTRFASAVVDVEARLAVVEAAVPAGGFSLANMATYASATLTPGMAGWFVVDLVDAASASYDYVMPFKVEVLDVSIRKTGAGVANTTTIKTGATAISDAIAADTDLALTRAAQINPAAAVIAAAGNLRITTARSAGSAAQQVRILLLRRA